MDFIAVDFETPNRKNDSICSMGITFVKNSEIIFNENELIDPETHFDYSNVKIHGITEKDVAGKPNFAAIWKKYLKYFNHYPIVMHNADFDTSVLYKAAFYYNIIMPDMDFYCTKKLCEENYQMEKYSLSNICQCMGIELDHHNSGSDSLCTALIMIKMINDENARIHVHLSSKDFHEKANSFACRAKKREAIKTAEPEKMEVKTLEQELLQPDCEYSDCEIEVEGKRFVLTGMFSGLSKAAVERFVEDHGGKVTDTVSKKTNYVVVGRENLLLVGTDGKSRKIKQAEELIKQGVDIKIIRDKQMVDFIRKAE